MSLNFQEFSPDLKGYLMDLPKLSRMERFAVLTRQRRELGWKSVAFLYGVERLEKQDWQIPWEELEAMNAGPTEPAQRTADGEVMGERSGIEGGEGAGNPEEWSEEELQAAQANRMAEVQRQQAAALKRALELNHAEGNRDSRGPKVNPIPVGADLSEFHYEPDYVLDNEGRVRHVISVEHQLERRLMEKFGIPHMPLLLHQQIAFHKQQLAKLEKADQSPRCEHIFPDGTTCRSPRMKTGRLCYAHDRMMQVRPQKLKLLPAEDANAVMMNLMEIGRALVDDEITERKAGLLMYQQQLALIALKGVTFKKTDPAEMVRELPRAERLDQQRAVTRKPERVLEAEEGRLSANRSEDGPSDATAPAVVGQKRPPQNVTLDADYAEAQAGSPGMNAVSRLDLGMTGEGTGLRRSPESP